MASKLSVTELHVLDTLLDDAFSNGESDNDEGDEIYAYLGELVLRCSELEAESPREPMADDWDGVDFSNDRVDSEDRDKTVDVEDIDEANTEEWLAELRFDDAFSDATSRKGSPVTDRLLRDEIEDEWIQININEWQLSYKLVIIDLCRWSEIEYIQSLKWKHIVECTKKI